MTTRILAVEDEPSILQLVQRILTRQGHEVVPARGGLEAIAALDSHDFDLAIVDYEIPGPNGLEVLQHLRKAQPDCARVLASGRLDLPVTMTAVNCGEVSRVLQKPYHWEQLVSVVDDVLASRAAQTLRMQRQRDTSEREDRRRLFECIEGDHIRLAVQPIYSATPDQRLIAFEGLLRSSHPVLDGPMSVLGAAERLGMLEEVGSVVAMRAAEWIERFPPGVKLFMNLHPTELGNPTALRNRLRPLHAVADRVVLEITERSRATDVHSWEQAIAMLTELGFAIAVDDLGAGYSSLSVLAELKPQYIKVDMSIVRDVDSDPRKQRLIDLLSRFADATDSVLIAEGVETEAEARTVRTCGAHLIQGYLLGRPSFEMPALSYDAISGLTRNH
jgi:EAL domain-containing protein (putative c-di-GMP-specific phosphodiesterase class I)